MKIEQRELKDTKKTEKLSPKELREIGEQKIDSLIKVLDTTVRDALVAFVNRNSSQQKDMPVRDDALKGLEDIFGEINLALTHMERKLVPGGHEETEE